MANTILLKRNSTAGTAPTSGDLTLGELALNTADGILYTKKTDSSIASFGGGTFTYVKQASTLPITSTSLVDTDLTVDLTEDHAGKTVMFEGRLLVSTTASAKAIRLGCTHSQTPAVSNYFASMIRMVNTSTTTETIQFSGGADIDMTIPTGLPAASTLYIAEVECLFVCDADMTAGQFKIRAKSEDGTSVSVHAGSFLRYMVVS